MECIVSKHTTLEADSVECNPQVGSSLFACGKYHLDEESRKRVGEISLYDFSKEDSSISMINSIERAGVLDCSWDKKGINLTTAEADGKIGLFSLENNQIKYSSEFNIGYDTISLAVDWNLIEENNILGSFSDGSIILLDVNNNELQEQNRFIAHESAEVWAAAYSKHSPNLFFSGNFVQ